MQRKHFGWAKFVLIICLNDFFLVFWDFNWIYSALELISNSLNWEEFAGWHLNWKCTGLMVMPFGSRRCLIAIERSMHKRARILLHERLCSLLVDRFVVSSISYFRRVACVYSPSIAFSLPPFYSLMPCVLFYVFRWYSVFTRFLRYDIRICFFCL